MSPDEQYPHWDSITLRWLDNDTYGHVNNVHYYSFFDTVVTNWLTSAGGLDLGTGPTIGLCVESHCEFSAPLSFPGTVRAGLRVGHVGTSSVRYEITLFPGDSDVRAASGHFVHVYVDRATRKPAPIPEHLRTALATLTTEQRP